MRILKQKHRVTKAYVKGFTLLEVLVTLAVASIAMAVAFPAMSNFVQDGRLTSQANDFVQAVRSARAEAIKRQVNIDLKQKTGGWKNGWEVQDNVAGSGKLKEWLGNKGVNATSSTANTITFRASGVRTVTTDFVIKFCDSRSKGRRIVIRGLIGISQVCSIGYPGSPDNCTTDNSCS